MPYFRPFAEDSTFVNDIARNVSGSVPGSSNQGGAIYNAPGAALTVTGSTFTLDSVNGVSGSKKIYRQPFGQGPPVLKPRRKAHRRRHSSEHDRTDRRLARRAGHAA